jgi:hypothetical protein
MADFDDSEAAAAARRARMTEEMRRTRLKHAVKEL